MTENETLQRLGLEAEKLIASDLGKYLDGVYLQDLEEAKEAFLELNPFQYTTLELLQNAIAELQAQVKIAQKVRTYLSETIINGRQAAQLESD